MDLIIKAKRFAETAHQGLTRKDGITPYITHPIRVAELLQKAGASKELICAGYLHDVVEDTPVSLKEIQAEFGERIAFLVAAHTEDKSKTWRQRKQQTIDTLNSAESEVKYLIIADRLDNLLSTEKELKAKGPAVWDMFNAGKEEQRWYNEEFVKHMSNGLHKENIPSFFTEYEQAVRRIFNTN